MNEENIKKLSPFISIILGLLLGYILLLVVGYNGKEAYIKLFEGGIKGITEGKYRRIGNTISHMTPLILTGLSVAFAFRTGLFNIGASGQMLFGGFLAVYAGVNFNLPQILLPLVAISLAGIGGAVFGFVPGYLKAKYNIHEVVICIMMNYISLYSVQYLVKETIPGRYATESQYVQENASLKMGFISDFFKGSSLDGGIFISLIALLAVYYILEKTTFGFELKAVGFNKDAAKYAGMKVNRNVIYSMMISGSLAGLAGAVYYIGYANHIKLGTIPVLGFDGIAVSLLGRNSPIGILFSSFLFGYLKNGSSFMASSTNIPRELVEIVIAIIIYFSAISFVIDKWLIKILSKIKKGGNNND